MTTEAQRARNARKRAKLRAHHSAAKRVLNVQAEDVPGGYRWDVAVRGIKDGFKTEDLDAVLDQPGLPSWVLETDCIELTFITDTDTTPEEIKQLARETVEDLYGFNKYDCSVRIACWTSRDWMLRE